MMTTWQKLELCKIRYYLDEHPDLYNFNHFEETLISAHLEKLPLLSNYSQVLFDYGKHLYSLKQNMAKDDEDHSFIYCFHLLTEYRLLLLPGNFGNSIESDPLRPIQSDPLKLCFTTRSFL
ncbi:hypothetical protein M2101_000718 [Parabacteroides sp. PM5-20]|nr:hypothetical protein [Parabacteroides sp. PM5-20]